MKYKLLIAYDGTHYSGWQIQPNATSIQQLIEKAVSTLLREPVRVIGAGRTDAGVHALGQVAHFSTSQMLDLRRFFISINGLLPPDIRIRAVEPAAEEFHACFSASSKVYRYHIWNAAFQDPFRRMTTTHIRRTLDLNLLKKAAQQFIGTHDFSAFANSQHTGAAGRNPIRTLFRLEISQPSQEELVFEFEADGFLYKMVRNIMGALIEVATHYRPLEDIAKLFATRNRRLTGRAAPPQGLFLVEVKYPAHLPKRRSVKPDRAAE